MDAIVAAVLIVGAISLIGLIFGSIKVNREAPQEEAYFREQLRKIFPRAALSRPLTFHGYGSFSLEIVIAGKKYLFAGEDEHEDEHLRVSEQRADVYTEIFKIRRNGKCNWPIMTEGLYRLAKYRAKETPDSSTDSHI
jgi:hypothetical protein